MLVVGSHETIPDIQVQPVVSFERLMMHDVIGGRIDDLAQPRVHQPARRVLVASMPGAFFIPGMLTRTAQTSNNPTA